VPGAWHREDLMRFPSLLPDMAVFGVFSLFAMPVTLAYLLYALLQFLGLCYAGGAAAMLLTGDSLTRSAARISTLLVLLCATALAEYYMHALALLLPLIHMGPFIASPLGAASAAALLHRTRPFCFVGLAVLISLVFLSDRLLLLTLALPALCGIGVLLIRRQASLAAGLRICLAVATGLAVGDIGLHVLRRNGLQVGGGMPIHPATFPAAWLRFLTDWPSYAGSHRWHTALSAVVLAIAVSVAARTLRRRGSAEPAAVFIAVFGVTAMTAELVFACCFHGDAGGYRYLLPIYVWSVVLASGLAGHDRPTAGPLLAAVLVCCSVRAFAGGSLAPPGFDTETARCIKELRDKLGLRAGLAFYWRARQTEVALAWNMQIDEIDASGLPQFGYNDPLRYTPDIHDVRRAPEYNSIITAFLKEAALRSRFGSPDTIRSCDRVTLWIYTDPERLRRVIATSLQELGKKPPNPLP
jgi:hypothetical protein